MLVVAIKYRVVLDTVTADKSLKLRAYELDDQEWAALEDLVRVLKVYFLSSPYFATVDRPSAGFQGGDSLLFA